MTPSFWQIAIVLVLVVLMFGRGKISELMGDVAKGIKSFKKGISEDEADADVDASDTVKTIEHDKAKTNINKTAKSSRGSKAKAS